MKKIVFTFGRMNPPTVGHEKLVNKVKEVAKSERADARIYLSHSQNDKKDPLSYQDKIRFAKKAFGDVIYKSQAKIIIQLAKELQADGYTDIIMVVGSDRVVEFRGLLTKYNGKDWNFNSIKVVSAGQRDADSEDAVAAMSGTKLRGLAKKGQFDDYTDENGNKQLGFASAAASKLSVADKKKMMKLIQQNLKEETEIDFLEEDRKPLSVQQRLARGRVMKRFANKIARMRKIKSKRMADKTQLQKRARKKAIALLRKRVAGERGKSYATLSPSEKISIDKLVAKKSKMVDKIAKRILNKVRKDEMERLKKARSVKSEGVIMEGVAQDKQIKDREGTQPAKYHSGLSKSTKEKRDSQFKSAAKKDSSDASAYPDKHAGDAGATTKQSKYTKKYKDMFGEGKSQERAKELIRREKELDKMKHDRMMDRARSADTAVRNRKEEFDITESAEAALRKKAEKSGISYGTLKKVYDRGMAAWRTGHRPGATQQQWAFARVNSYITKGKTYHTADSDLRKEGVEESTKEYGKSMNRILDKKKKDMISNKDKATLSKLADLMKRANENVDEAQSWRSTGHYTIDGKEWEGDQHAYNGVVMTGKTHSKDSQRLYHYKDLPANIRAKIQADLDENWLTVAMSKVVNKKGYDGAKKILKDVLARKEKEAGSKGKMRHGVEYYAAQIAKQFTGVDARTLAKMVTEQHGAGEYGTLKLRKKYEKDTPMEEIKSPKEKMMDKAIDALHRRATSKGEKESIGGYAFDVARSFNGITPKELERAYNERHGK